MWSIYLKEIRSLLSSLVAYLVILVFLVIIGLFMWVFPASNVLDFGYASLAKLFEIGPFVFLFLIPAITMRAFAEEKKTGTMELLLTQPLSDWEIILGKYLASFTLVILAILPTYIYYNSLYLLGDPVGNIDAAGTIGSYIGLLLLGAAFTAIGIFASSLTDNQIISFLMAVFFSFLLYQFFFLLGSFFDANTFIYFLEQLGMEYHYTSLRKGLIDSRDLVYFLSLIALMLISTKLVLGSRKW